MFIGGVEFFEYGKQPMSPKISGGQEDGRIIRDLWTRAENDEDRWNAEKVLIGYSVVNTDNNGTGSSVRNWISRSAAVDTPVSGQLPGFYPAQTDGILNPMGAPFLWISNFDPCEPLGLPEGPGADAFGSAIYTAARYRVTYDTRPYQIKSDHQVLAPAGPLSAAASTDGVARPDEGTCLKQNGWLGTRYISRYYKPGSRTLTIRDGMMINLRTAAPINQGLAIREAISDVVYTWHAVPLWSPGSSKYGVPFGAIQTCLSCVNNALFDLNFPAGTLLLDSVDLKQYFSKLGQILCDVVYRMKFLPHVNPATGFARGWNSYGEVIAPKGNWTYDFFTTDGNIPGTTNVAFPPQDFSALFRPDQT